MHKDKRSSPVDKRSTPRSGSVGNLALVLLRGGGDLASGVALRLQRAGINVVITELAQPLAVRRAVSFAETVYEERHTVEEVAARLVKPEQVPAALEAGEIPVLIDPNADILLSSFLFLVVIDARLLKAPPTPLPIDVPLHIGLGPGFHAGVDCQAVIETRRSHTLGRVYWDGTTQPDSGQPEGEPRRVLRAPSDGILKGHKQIGEHCEPGELIAAIQSSIVNRKSEIVSPFRGVLRGLIRDGIHVTKGLKIGDVDPRDDPSACFLVSDKALAIGGAVLEAILTREEIRGTFFTTKDTKGH
ncbi:MAG: EF2563 family selenium-dependent molybdenum hydroxylase system protein [Anaerolineales bacterium]|nr:EF2563 family selenium-dependent molybdenum hydroxylase system protein [Anaerolineales bacterium]